MAVEALPSHEHRRPLGSLRSRRQLGRVAYRGTHRDTDAAFEAQLKQELDKIGAEFDRRSPAVTDAIGRTDDPLFRLETPGGSAHPPVKPQEAQAWLEAAGRRHQLSPKDPNSDPTDVWASQDDK
jgi:hypothetical protein